MNAKRKGTRQEHRSKAILEAAGYAVTRAAGSDGMESAQVSEVSAVETAVHRWRDRQRLPDVREL